MWFAKMTAGKGNTYTIQDMPLSGRHLYFVAVCSMEQLIGASLSTIAGIIIPLLNLLVRPELTSIEQGLLGASGLIGIAVGSSIIGPLSDRQGYLWWFRICAILIIVGSLVASLDTSMWTLCSGLFIAGFGTGGGYTLDSAYISELMPDKWRSFMIGVAKASCAPGFLLPAVFAVVILHQDSTPDVWRSIVWIMSGLGVVTLLLRLRWAESPGWLMARGRMTDAQKAAQFFLGRDVTICTPQTENGPQQSAKGGQKTSLFKGKNLLRVIYSGIPWACEGLGVYGIGVFLPVLIMALGIDRTHATGIAKIINSVELTAIINFCILPGFIIGLLVVNRLKHSFMLWSGFLGSAVGMCVLLIAYELHWPLWVSVVSFMWFEILLNAGPHLITYIIPATIYPVEMRGEGSGVADFLGKAGGILGVFFMPMWLKIGGMSLVLLITIGVMIMGAVIAFVFSRLLGAEQSEN